MEPISSVLKQSPETTIHTAGGAYVSGNVFAETFIGRDQYNYYFIGLAPLVHDPTRRFRNFLHEYLGTPTQSVPFGGRQAQLEELHRWLNDAAAPPYYLMTAEAGRGKSALVCRWMEEVRHKRPEVEVIFIPISIRFETAAQDTVFAALAARLAQFYDEPLKPAALSGAQWQGVCESYLDRTPPAGKQLLIILDGLDEASGWHFGAGFFSTDPPPGLRVVVTARLRVGESTPQGWAATLGWQDRLTRTATLPPLSRMGVEEALASMGDPLAGLADQAAIIEQLYRLTEGDPLLVRLYVQEFEKQKATVGTLNSAALQQMTPGLQGYFDHWWKGQKAQWRAQGSDPEKEEANLRLLLDALSAALGPLTLDDLANLHLELESSRLIRAQIQSVERWVIGDGKTQGYNYSHPQLVYYFWEQLSDKEQAAWDERFCAWGATTLSALNAEQLDPKAAPAYLLRHYGEHLQRIHAPAEAFYALISNGWRKAWAEVDITHVGFLNDVLCARKHAEQSYNPSKSGKAIALVNQIKAVLCQASIQDYVPPCELLGLAMKVGLYTPIQVLSIAKSVRDEKLKSCILIVLAEHLTPTLRKEALDVARTIKDKFFHTRVQVAFAPYLSNALSEETFKAILENIKDSSDRAHVLALLALHLPEYRRVMVLEDALNAAQTMNNPLTRVRVLALLASYLPEHQRVMVLEDALNTAQMVEDDTSRISGLAALAQYLSNYGHKKVLEEAFDAVQKFKDKDSRVHDLTMLIPYLPESEVKKTLEKELAIDVIGDDDACEYVLRTLRPYLPEHIWMEVFREESVLWHKSLFIKVLELYGLHPQSSEHAEMLLNTLVTPRLIEIKHQYLASNFTESIEMKALRYEKIFTELLAIHDVHQKSQQKKARLKLVKNLHITIPHNEYYPLIVALASNLTENKRWPVIKEVWRRSSPLSVYSAGITFIPYLSDDLFEKEVAVIGGNRSRYFIGEVAALAPYLSTELLGKALVNTRTVQNEFVRVCSIAALAPYLPTELFEEALIVVHSLRRQSDYADSMASSMPQQLDGDIEAFRQALGAKSGNWEIAKYHASRLPAKFFREAIEIVCAINDGLDRARALKIVAPHLPVEMFSAALMAASTIEQEKFRAYACEYLAPYLSAELLGQAMSIVCIIRFQDEYTDDATIALATRLTACALYLPKESYLAFIQILSALSGNLRPQSLYYIERLMPFILALAGDEAPQAAEGIYHAIQEVCAWWP